MRGPRTLAAVLSREGRGRGQSLPHKGPGFKDAGNAKRARHPTPARGQAYPGPIPPAPASEGRSSHPGASGNSKEGAQEKPRSGGQKDQTEGTTTCSCSKGSKFPGPFRPRHISQDPPHSAPRSVPPATASPFPWGSHRPAWLNGLAHLSSQLLLSVSPSQSLFGVGSTLLSLSLYFLPSEVRERLQPKSRP